MTAAVLPRTAIHTPGPFLISSTLPHTVIARRGDRQIVIAAFGSARLPEGEREANMRLLMAGPEMLEALYAALPYVETAQDDPAYKRGVVARITRQMREAIRLAELCNE